ncbi:MAG: radical SAM protein [bacterium]
MAENKHSWREDELSLQEVIKKYPDVSPFVILKTDVQRRGVDFTQRAIDAVDPDRDAVVYRGIYSEKNDRIPNGLILRDGTTILADRVVSSSGFNGGRDPYLIDIVDGKAVLTDEGKVIEEVGYWPKPDYFDKVTSSGKPMWQVLVARPQRMDINLYQNCDFWKDTGMGCKFCPIAATYSKTKKVKCEHLDYQDVAEAVAEALKQPGRFRMIQLCSGSLLGGEELLDDEIDQYITMLKLLEKNFSHKKVMTQLISTAHNERQLRRLHEETILTGYTADIEVLDEEIFNWICPGKAKYIGYQEWKRRLYQAAEIFGPGAVNTGIVSGVELVKPNGFRSEEEALEKGLAEAEELARHGVGVAQTVYRVAEGSYFQKQKAASLDYLTAFAKGLDTLQRKYRLEAYFDDYRTCGNHPNTDLARI